jgi:hypothetical protein
MRTGQRTIVQYTYGFSACSEHGTRPNSRPDRRYRSASPRFRLSFTRGIERRISEPRLPREALYICVVGPQPIVTHQPINPSKHTSEDVLLSVNALFTGAKTDAGSAGFSKRSDIINIFPTHGRYHTRFWHVAARQRIFTSTNVNGTTATQLST